jgi:hypothetical protein
MEFRGELKEALENLRSCTSPSVSSSNECDIILDRSTLKLKKSINGGSYVDLGGGGGSGFSSMRWFCTLGNNAIPALTEADRCYDAVPNFSLVYVPGNVHAVSVRLPFLLTNNQSTQPATWSNDYTIQIGIYTKTGNTFSTASSTFGWFTFSGVGSIPGYALLFQTDFIVDLVGGSTYLIGVFGTSWTTSGYEICIVGQRVKGYVVGSGTTASTYNLSGLIADGTLGTRFPAPFVGGRGNRITYNLPSSILNTQIVTSHGGYVVPYILFTSIDPETGASF